jgi:preprotein translocase subunit SecD
MSEDLATRVLNSAVAEPPHAITAQSVRGTVISRRRRRGALISAGAAVLAAGVTAAAVLVPASGHTPADAHVSASGHVLTFAGADTPLTTGQAASAQATLAARLHFLGVSGSVAVSGAHLQVRAPIPTAWLSSLEKPGVIQFRPAPSWHRVTSAADCPAPDPDRGTACNRNRGFVYTLGPTILTNADVARVQVVVGSVVGSAVLITFTADGTKLFAAATARIAALGYPRNGLAICVDGTVVFASPIFAVIPGGQTQIEGDFTHQQARLLAAEISGTPLPEPLAPAS